MPKSGARISILSDGTVESRNRIVCGDLAPANGGPPPPSVEVDAEGVRGGGGRSLGRHDIHPSPELGQQFCGRSTARIPHQPVVRQDLHLVVGEDHRKKGAVLTFCSAHRGVDPRGGRGAVVAVGHVQRRHSPEQLGDRLPGQPRHDPEPVLDAVGRDEVEFGLRPLHLPDRGVERRHRAVGEEDGLVVSSEGLHVPHPVLLFVGTGLLVLLDAIPVVFSDARAGHEPCLSVVPHPLGVHVEAGLGMGHQDTAGQEILEALATLPVDHLRVFFHPLGKVDLRPGHMEKAIGVPSGQGEGFPSGNHVIGGRSDPGHQGRGRSKCAKRRESGHGTLL